MIFKVLFSSNYSMIPRLVPAGEKVLKELYQYLQTHHPEVRARLFTAACGGRAGNNKHRMEQESIRLDIRRIISAQGQSVS